MRGAWYAIKLTFASILVAILFSHGFFVIGDWLFKAGRCACP